MNIRRRTLILISVFIIVFLLCVEATDVNSKEQGEVREITIVTITPGHEKKEEPEPINFDLQHLAIVGKEEPDAGRNEENDKSNAEFDGEHGAGPEIAGADPVMPEEGTDGTPDGTGEYTGDDAAEGIEWSESEDNLPQDGASGTDTGRVEEAEGSGIVSELVGAESGGKTGSEGSVDGESEQRDTDDDSNEFNGDTGYSEDSGDGWIYYGNCRITHYDTGPCCCGEWASGYTASGTLATVGRTVASGEDLPFGTEIMINGYVYIVEDRGVPPYCVDILVEDHQTALNMGQYYTDVYVRYSEE